MSRLHVEAVHVGYYATFASAFTLSASWDEFLICLLFFFKGLLEQFRSLIVAEHILSP